MTGAELAELWRSICELYRVDPDRVSSLTVDWTPGLGPVAEVRLVLPDEEVEP